MFAKYFMTTALLGLCVCAQVQAEDKYVLKQPENHHAVGTIFHTEIKVQSDHIKVESLNNPQRPPVKGTMNRVEKAKVQIVEGNDLVIEVLEIRGLTEMNVNGEALPPRETGNIFEGVRLIAKKKDQQWSIQAEDASLVLNDEQKSGIKHLEDGYQANEAAYDATPRSVGETWNRSQDYLKYLSGVDSKMKGTINTTFVKIIDFNDEKCAVLLTKYQVTGESDQGYTLEMKGEQTVIRSLTQFVNYELKESVESVMTSGEKMGVKVTQPFEKKITTVLKLPH